MAQPSTAQVFANPELWHQKGALPLGCLGCPERSLCGGLSVKAQMYDCTHLCCGNPSSCVRTACPKNVGRYSKLVNEVGGLTLKPYLGRVRRPGALPDYIPCILDSGSIIGPLNIPVVAVSLYSVIDWRTGLARFTSRQDLLRYFKIAPTARVVLTATAEDRHLERFWERLEPKATATSLRELDPLLVATPNFSLYCDVPRHDNLVSLARIRFCFEAFAGAGLPVALHVNGRTPHDFARWAEFVAASPGVDVLTYELGTIGKSRTRRAQHVDELVRLASRVDRRLRLVIRGGYPYLPMLESAFRQVTFLDTSAMMRTKMRRSATRHKGRLLWPSAPTATNEPLDTLLMHNMRVSRAFRHTNRKCVPLHNLDSIASEH